LVQKAYFYAIFTVQNCLQCELQKFYTFNFCTLPLVTWNLKSQHHHVPSPCRSGSRQPSKWHSPAVEAPVAHRHSCCRPSSRNRPSLVFAAAFACRRLPSQLLSPTVTVAVAAAAFACLRNCRRPPSQLLSPVVACRCRPLPPIMVSSTARLHCIVRPTSHGIIATDN
jgi:hypothetical protein